MRALEQMGDAGAVMLLRYAAGDLGKPGARQEAGALRGDAAPSLPKTVFRPPFHCLNRCVTCLNRCLKR